MQGEFTYGLLISLGSWFSNETAIFTNGSKIKFNLLAKIYLLIKTPKYLGISLQQKEANGISR
jgi:hypothetical protein